MKRTPTEEEKRTLRLLFDTRPEHACDDCGGYHLRACPRIKRQVWIGEGMAAGTRTEVEYWERWNDDEVIYPEEVFDDGEPDERDA